MYSSFWQTGFTNISSSHSGYGTLRWDTSTSSWERKKQAGPPRFPGFFSPFPIHLKRQ